MRKLLLPLLFILPAIAFARSYDTSHLPYSDAPRERRTAVAVSALTEEGILQGYPDGTFRPQTLVNRAEFLKIAMKLAPEALPAVDTGCFPDIDPAAWYAPFVCAAKRDGIVSGDELAGIDSSLWRFHPERTVNYVEAVKMLTGVLGIPLVPSDSSEWYQTYLLTAETQHIGLPDARADQMLRRGEVAELAASFLAYTRGDLPALRAAQSGQTSSASSVSSVSSVSSASSLSSLSSFSSSSSSSSSSVAIDPLTDYSTTPAFLRLGTTSNIIGAIKIFNTMEPFLVEDITVNFSGATDSVDQVRIYASADGRYLGGASQDSSNPSSYKLHLSSGILTVPKSTEVSAYARAVLSPYKSGGISGETVNVSSFAVEGVGGWSNRRYSQTSTDTFSTSQTARSTFTSITNAGAATDSLVAGTQRTLGSFLFRGGTGDGSAELRILGLEIEAGISGGVTLSNVKLGVDGSSARFDCSVAGSTITCASLSSTFGDIEGTRTVTLYGDIALASGSSHGGVQLSLTPGTISSPGSITWTDGTSTFRWVPFDDTVLQGTYFSS
ncbi:MAG: S-layer homology domain-containing protein [Candidatus Peribacteraceae bacterium]|nr:S-layer homology domain-containing protein [Candidatus Peribacteraceae bacterium]